MLMGALPAAFAARCLPNPVASGAVTTSTQAPAEGRKDAAEQLLVRHFEYLDPFLVKTLFFWSHLYLNCTEASFELYTNVVDNSELKRGQLLGAEPAASAAGHQLLP
jgi:hypothetical protein